MMRLASLAAAAAAAAAAMLVPAGAELVGAAVLPHGDFALAPDLVPGSQAALAVHRGALIAADRLAALAPQVIVLVTPHGQAADAKYVVYSNSAAAGFADLGADLHNASAGLRRVHARRELDAALAAALVASAGCRGRCTGLSSWANSEPQPLRWGEVVPLALLEQALPAAKVVVVALPSRRLAGTAAMVPELLALGAGVAGFLDGRPERAALVMSCDLAHTHLASGPYGFSPTAAPFDALVGRWARGPARAEAALLQQARGLVDEALSCGYPALVMLHGAMRATGLHEGRWRSRRLALGHPTYYGMLVAVFEPRNASALAAVAK